MDTRIATYSDAEQIIGLDQIAQTQRDRVNFIHQSITSRNCYVASEKQRIRGYGVLDYSFFSNGFVSMLYVDAKFRRRGIGSALMKHLERVSKKSRLFTSMEKGNTQMQALLKKLGYKPSGTIENLTEGEPELFYFKQLKR